MSEWMNLSDEVGLGSCSCCSLWNSLINQWQSSATALCPRLWVYLRKFRARCVSLWTWGEIRVTCNTWSLAYSVLNGKQREKEWNGLVIFSSVGEIMNEMICKGMCVHLSMCALFLCVNGWVVFEVKETVNMVGVLTQGLLEQVNLGHIPTAELYVVQLQTWGCRSCNANWVGSMDLFIIIFFPTLHFLPWRNQLYRCKNFIETELLLWERGDDGSRLCWRQWHVYDWLATIINACNVAYMRFSCNWRCLRERRRRRVSCVHSF